MKAFYQSNNELVELQSHKDVIVFLLCTSCSGPVVKLVELHGCLEDHCIHKKYSDEINGRDVQLWRASAVVLKHYQA